MNKNTVTNRIYDEAFKLLEKNPEGMRWTDLNREIAKSDPTLHPKTINGCVWKMVENYPDKVYKPNKGIFRLKKFK